MESKCERFQKIFFGRIFTGFFERFFISLLLFFMVYLASANDYFFSPIERKYNIAELEELHEQKNDYRNPYAVCIYIYHIISNDMPKSYESKRLLQKIELYFENCDGSHLPTEDYLFFLSDKSIFYHLKNDEDKMLKTLKQFHIKHPYILDDFHGAAGVKRNTISSILIDSFKKGLLRRPLVVFVSSFDVFSWKEKLFGYFLLPVFAIKNNPLCLLYWLWLVFVIASFITVLYIICKLIKSKKMKRAITQIFTLFLLGALTVPVFAGKVLAEIEYFYSDDGTLIGKAFNGKRVNFEYDLRGQLLAVKDVSGKDLERYTYDPEK